MNEDLKEFLRLLNSHHVEYLVIGAHALAVHGLPRYTEDLDVWIARTQENVGKLSDAMKEFGMPIGESGEAEFLEERRMVRLGLPPNRVDILNFGPNIPFGEAWERRLEASLEGVPVHVVSRQDFIQAKKDAGRPKDIRDLEELGEL